MPSFPPLLPSLRDHSLARDESDECFFGESEERGKAVCRDEWRERLKSREKGGCLKSYEIH